MMDISDGLSSEMLHICKQSHTGCRIYEERIPIDYQTAVMAEELGMNLKSLAYVGLLLGIVAGNVAVEAEKFVARK